MLMFLVSVEREQALRVLGHRMSVTGATSVSGFWARDSQATIAVSSVLGQRKTIDNNNLLI
jgi:hypothetical protein